MKIYRVTTSRAMPVTPEVVELMKQGKNPYDYFEPTGEAGRSGALLVAV